MQDQISAYSYVPVGHNNLSMSHHLGALRATEWCISTQVVHTYLSSADLISWLKLSPVHFLILSTYGFVCLPLFLDPSVPPCWMVLAKLHFHLITRPNHCNCWLCTIVNRCSCLLICLSISSRTCLCVECEPVRSSEPVTSSICSSSQSHRWVFHLCVNRPRFTSIEEDWCYQCSQQTNSGFHRYVLIFPGINTTHETLWSMI